MMQYGLKSHTIRLIQQVFAAQEKIEKAILYGSRAKGNHEQGSDIDLTLVAPDLKFKELLRIETQLDDLLLPYKIDLSLHHHIHNRDLLDHIQRIGKIFYEKIEADDQ